MFETIWIVFLLKKKVSVLIQVCFVRDSLLIVKYCVSPYSFGYHGGIGFTGYQCFEGFECVA